MRLPLALAFDYDVTLTSTGILSDSVRAALKRARGAGFALVLVTGRQLPDLERVLPDARSLFDRLVLENGALLVRDEGPAQRLALPVDRRLADALEAQGFDVDRGQVLIAAEAKAEPVAVREASRLGLDVRMVLNRASLMVLPAEITKATGLSHAAASLGVELADVLAVGDAENDREMLEAAGAGVAVGDALEELKAVADRVLEAPDGEGVIQLIDELVAGLRAP